MLRRVRALITGSSGFVGAHLATLCRGHGCDVVGVARATDAGAAGPALSQHLAIDLTDAAAAREMVASTSPDLIFHLAADASVAASWRSPAAMLANNLQSALNLLEAVRLERSSARVLVACSGEQYGRVMASELPVVEDHPFRPQNPYAVSKAAVDLLAGFYADAQGLTAIRTRAFNHAGPGQSDTYVASSLARQIAIAEARGEETAVVKTGNVDTRRDFTDVRDVVGAYWMALERGRGGVFNVCSGRSVAVRDILAGLARHAQVDVRQRTDPALVRAHDVMEIRGSHEKLTRATGWEPEIPLEQTLRDTLDWWRTQVRTEATAQ